MLVAGSVDVDEALETIAKARPVFHSEADFQFALAWQVKSVDPEIQVTLESRPLPGVHLDLAFARRDQYSAIELKYLTRRWDGAHDGEQYRLANQSAHDYGRYGVVKDVSRVESFIRDRPGANGAVIVLTNDPAYRSARDDSAANDSAFRISDGRVLHGTHSWRRPPASVERGRSLEISRPYALTWAPYSTLKDGTELWKLVIELPAFS